MVQVEAVVEAVLVDIGLQPCPLLVALLLQ
jgi:hypothetical protein